MSLSTAPNSIATRPVTSGAMMLRLFAVFALTLTLGAGPALAKKKSKKSSKIARTKIESFDKVFDQAKLLDNKVISAENRVAKSRKALNTALKISKKGTYVDAIRELKKSKEHLKLLQRGKAPRLSIRPTTPAAVQKDLKKALKAVNTLMENMPAAIKDLKDASDGSKALIKEANKFPLMVQREVEQEGESGLWFTQWGKKYKVGKTVVTNLNIMGTIPGRAAATTLELADISSTIVRTFK